MSINGAIRQVQHSLTPMGRGHHSCWSSPIAFDRCEARAQYFFAKPLTQDRPRSFWTLLPSCLGLWGWGSGS